MKLLFDQNLSHRLCRMLVDMFPEAAHVRLSKLERASDDCVAATSPPSSSSRLMRDHADVIARFAESEDLACLKLY